MAKWNVIKRNIWTCEERIVETAPDATIADRIAMRILLGQPNYVAWIEPVQGWTAETKRAAVIAGEWESWRMANGLAQSDGPQGPVMRPGRLSNIRRGNND